MAFIVEQMKSTKYDYISAENKFIYYLNIDRDKYIIFLVDIKDYSTIKIFSSIYLYTEAQVFVPNSNTPQIISIQNKIILFNFEITQDLLINIVSITCSGNLYWEKKQINMQCLI